MTGWALIALLLAPPTGAETFGALRLSNDLTSAFDVDALGTPHDRTSWTTARLRIGARLPLTRAWHLTAEVEALSGRVWGDATHLGQAAGSDTLRLDRHRRLGVTPVRPRQLALHWRGRVARVDVGQQAFHWGAGLVAHDGVTPSPFGQPWQGDLVERAQLTLAPGGGLRLLAGAELVFADDQAELIRGDHAGGGLLAVQVTRGATRLGLLSRARLQRDRAEAGAHTRRRTLTFDAYAHHAGRRWTVEAEVAAQVGDTDRPSLGYAPPVDRQVRAWGGLLRGAWRPVDGLTAGLALGYASGDDDPTDLVDTRFTFNADHNVGLLLFDQLLPLLGARAADTVATEGLRGRAGLRFDVPQGGVHNAAYLFPTLRWQPLSPFEVRAAYLFAAAPAAVLAPFGAGPFTGFAGNAAGQIYGHELDLALRGEAPLGGLVGRVIVEGALFFAGDAFDPGPDLSPVALLRTRAEVAW